MTPIRIAAKIFVTPDPRAEVELEPFIGLFHRFIQESALEGLLIDVADYAHVPEGPGVILIGHDVDYGIDASEGRYGLLVTRKRLGDTPVADVVLDVLRKALIAVLATEQSGATPVRFDPRRIEISLIDRLATPNSAEGFEQAKKQIAPVIEKLFGASGSLEREREDDARRALTLCALSSDASVDARSLLERLGGDLESHRAEAGQSDWDVSVETLKRLREEGAEFVLIDVRELHEVEICSLGGEHVPLDRLQEKMASLARESHVIVHCKVGGRGAKAVAALRDAGFENAWNLKGGILAWIDHIDPSLSRY